MITHAVRIACSIEEHAHGLLRSLRQARQSRFATFPNLERFFDCDLPTTDYHLAFTTSDAHFDDLDMDEPDPASTSVGQAVDAAITLLVLLGDDASLLGRLTPGRAVASIVNELINIHSLSGRDAMPNVRDDLLRVGLELFSARGFKDTSVADLTKAAGVAVGSFYRYFPSKEQLFSELFLEQNAQLKARIMAEVSGLDDPVLAVRRVVALNLAGMKADPILAAWYDRELFARLEKDFVGRDGVQRGLAQAMNADTIAALSRWKAEGKLRDDVDESFVVALLTAVAVVDAHKAEVGVDHFPRLVEFLTEAVMNAVVAP